MKALVIAGIGLRRLFRDRISLFFLFVLPFLLILVMGAAFGGAARPALGVVGDGPVLDELRAEPAIRIERLADEAALRSAVEPGEVSAGLAPHQRQAVSRIRPPRPAALVCRG
ncbi:hypothetical protein ABZ816_31300 [Actinosynnema sp. NPDC047251]|uniref:Putative secreted protein n=1 Tax=Saccharothrix espanaensis (strain ATCC 51144 / DSM 44229 / JCM 9112 / NBRC 15066 / NRRL 15764) TaxID=1179773 RepID=K0K7K7_SACES|nr:hypothetical protein [Saccharothrix espanaensis]CCH32879.1 putative secreted protein [Saccharothrix espanaensis DSM 44229]